MTYPYTPVLHAPALFTIEVEEQGVKVNWLDAEKYQAYLTPDDMGMEEIMRGLKRFFRGVMHWEENKLHRKWVVEQAMKSVSLKSPEMYDFLMEG